MGLAETVLLIYGFIIFNLVELYDLVKFHKQARKTKRGEESTSWY